MKHNEFLLSKDQLKKLTGVPLKSDSLTMGGRQTVNGPALDSNTVNTVYPIISPALSFLPLQINNNSPIVLVSNDGRARQWNVICQNSFADLVAGRYSGIVIEQEFNGAASYLCADPSDASGEPEVRLVGSTTLLPYGTIPRVGGLFRAYGDKIKIFPYASQAVGGKLSIATSQDELTSFTMTRKAPVGPVTKIPYMATHVSVNNLVGNLHILDMAGTILSTVLNPVPGTYYPLEIEAHSISDSAGPVLGTRTVSFRIFG